MAVNKYASFEFRFNETGSGSQSESLANNGVFSLVLPNNQNVLIKSVKVGCWILNPYAGSQNNSNANAGRPYFQIRFFVLSDSVALRQQKGSVLNDFDTNLSFKGGLDEVQIQLSNDNPETNLDIIGNGITVLQAGFNVANLPVGGATVFFGVTIQYQDLLCV